MENQRVGRYKGGLNNPSSPGPKRRNLAEIDRERTWKMRQQGGGMPELVDVDETAMKIRCSQKNRTSVSKGGFLD